MTESAGDDPKLNRTLGLPLVTLYGLGNILGAGIYGLTAALELSARVEAVELGVDGVTLRYLQRGQDHELRARAVVNASGPWVNRVLATARPAYYLDGFPPDARHAAIGFRLAADRLPTEAGK